MITTRKKKIKCCPWVGLEPADHLSFWCLYDSDVLLC